MIGPDGKIIAANGGGEGSQGGGGAEEVLCTDTPSPGTALMRRLSHEEYGNTLTDLLPASVTPTISTAALSFLEDPISLSFHNNVNFLNVTPVLAQEYMDAAEAVAAKSVLDMTKLMPCTPANAGAEAACAEQFIKTFGRRLYRHPLSTDEVASLKAVYASARPTYDFKSGIEFTIDAMLQSPNFLYRVELDQPGATGVRPVTGVELASRISYLIWHSAPDDALLTSAENGDLVTAADAQREALRLLADPDKSSRGFSFYEQWMDLDELSGLRRNATTYPGLPANLPDLLHAESQAFIQNTVFNGDAKLSTLLTAPYTYVNGALATHYGYSGVTGTAFQKVNYPTLRGGLLMQGGVLAVHDKETRTSIVRRGLRIRTEVLCQIVNSPPPGIPPLGPVDMSVSQAARLAEHRTNPACSGCHDMMDPIGGGFESVDAVGRDRTNDETGHPIAPAGSLVGAGDATGPFSDGMAMVTQLAGSTIVRDCFVQQAYRFSMGRKEEAADACSRKQLRDRFASSGGDIKDLVVGVTQTDDFLFRAVTPP